MGWLGTWARRRAVIVDNTNIDSDLLHFPVPIVLGVSVGQSGQDVSDIFDEVGASYKKIAITKSDGTTQVYGEVEDWDDTAEKAVVWISKSDLTITAASTTTLYFYFDSDQPDNTAYIGGTAETPAQNVWDSGFIFVCHMADSTTSTVKDSTANGLNGTKWAANKPLEADEMLGKSQNFQATVDRFTRITLPDSDGWDVTQLTFETHVRFNSFPSVGAQVSTILSRDNTDSGDSAYYLRSVQNQTINFSIAGAVIVSSTVVTTGVDYYLAGTWDASELNMYVDGVVDASPVSATGSVTPIDEEFLIGTLNFPNTTYLYPLDGYLGEVRVSSADRGGAWVKATNYSLIDDILVFGNVQSAVACTPIAGVTAPNAIPAAIAVCPPVTVSLGVVTGGLFSGAFVSAPAVPTTTGILATPVMQLACQPLGATTEILATPVMQLACQPLGTAAGVSIAAAVNIEVSTGVTRFFLALTGSQDGLSDEELPMSSFQSRRRTGAPTYLSAVVPTIDYADDIIDRPNGKIQIYQAYVNGGVVLQKELIIETDLERADIYLGEVNDSVVLAGYTTSTFSPKAVTLTGSTYRAILDGKTRHRLAAPYIFLNPGDTVTIDSDVFEVGVMSYAISPQSQTFEIEST